MPGGKEAESPPPSPPLLILDLAHCQGPEDEEEVPLESLQPEPLPVLVEVEE